MNCGVIQDLLPLYVDGCCSEESAQLVREHLNTCECCRKAYQQMQGGCQEKEEVMPVTKLRRVSDWKASVLQSLALFVSFAVVTLGVILEGNTPAGEKNGLWAVLLIVPATAYLLSLANWFFLRLYKSRKGFSWCSCAVTGGLVTLGYVWAWLHYGRFLWIGVVTGIVFCVLSKVLSAQYGQLLGKE